MLLPKLVEKLKKSGVDKKYFQPIISKSKKILGYTFITDNILPQKVILMKIINLKINVKNVKE